MCKSTRLQHALHQSKSCTKFFTLQAQGRKKPNARCCCAALCRDTTGFGKIEVFIILLIMLKDLPSDHEAVRRKTRCGAAAALAEVF